jgi:hypothetical protein
MSPIYEIMTDGRGVSERSCCECTRGELRVYHTIESDELAMYCTYLEAPIRNECTESMPHTCGGHIAGRCTERDAGFIAMRTR